MHDKLLSGIKEEKSGEDLSPNSRKAFQNMVSANANQKNKIERENTLDYKDWSMDIDAEHRGSRYPISTLEDGLTESTRDSELRNFYGELVDEDDYDRDLIKELF